jgi:hypothetical protein
MSIELSFGGGWHLAELFDVGVVFNKFSRLGRRPNTEISEISNLGD